MSSQHARLAPSSAGRWGPDGCPGSVAMEERYPEPGDTDDARQGEAAHHYLAMSLLGVPCAVGDLAPNGVPIDAEMVECAQAMLEDVRDTLHACTPGTPVLVEHRVHMARSVHPDNWGTPDVIIFDAPRKIVSVWDYKYGHRYVDAFRNWQCIDYLVGAFESHGYDLTARHGEPGSIAEWRCNVTIAQPRNYAPEGPLREWYLSGSQLMDYCAQLRTAAHAASQPDAELRTGSHCRDCSAAVQCAANQRARGNAVDLAYRHVHAEMPDAALALEKLQNDTALARLKARQDAIDAAMIGRIRSGRTVPGYAVEHVQGRRRWTKPAAEVAALGDLFGVELRKEPECITPTQAIKKGIDASVINTYSETPTGAAKLVETDMSSVYRAFGSER